MKGRVWFRKSGADLYYDLPARLRCPPTLSWDIYDILVDHLTLDGLVFEFLEGASLTRLDYRQSTASLRRRAVPQDYVALREKGPRFSGLSLAWADTAQLTIQTLPQPSLPHLLDRRGPESAVKEGRKEEFCVGELPQDVGDVLGGMLEQAGIGVVIHHADIGMKGASVKGVEDGASHALSHIVRQ